MSNQSSCSDFWVSTKNSNHLTFAWTSKENAANDPSILSNVITGDETWVKPTTRKPKFNPFSGKVRGHLDRRKQGKWEATSSQCWFVSFIKRELFTKNLFLLVKQLILHSTLKFWNVYGRMCEATWSVAEQHMAAPLWQCASRCCPPDSTVFDR